MRPCRRWRGRPRGSSGCGRLTPTRWAPTASARSASGSSCTSTRAVSPSSRAWSWRACRAASSRGGTIGGGPGRRRRPGPRAAGTARPRSPCAAPGCGRRPAPRGRSSSGAAEAAFLGEHADRCGSAALVGRRQGGRVGDVGEVALARAAPLDLGDHRRPAGAESRHRVERRRDGRGGGGPEVGLGRLRLGAGRGPRARPRRCRRARTCRDLPRQRTASGTVAAGKCWTAAKPLTRDQRGRHPPGPRSGVPTGAVE